ncbi:hypothetical protein V1508DRAFT_408983 [Lipomyces doorenjongii]|uniref:uncharacterized protein n=1 Tax=Lipomyces doorenjongii TaxID=383834 RepID=UPI0034CD4449
MTSILGKMVARRFFKESANKAFGSEDPYFEEIPQEELGRKKKGSKRRRPPPPGLSQNDTKVLTEVRRRAYHLDMSLGFCCCGIGIGWSAVISIIPGIGAAIATYLSYCVVQAANKIDGGLPNWLYTKMMTNVIIDFALGLVPLVGDVVDILYKANSRNALLLESYLRERGKNNIANGNFPT